jgi:hypothetical protein
VKKALVAAAIAAAALAGVIVAVVVSSGSTSPTPQPADTSVPTTTAALLPLPGSGSPREKSFIVGTVDDSLEQQDSASARLLVDVSHRAGFDAVDVSALWKPGQTAASGPTLRALRNVAAATRRDHVKLFVVAAHGLADATPTDSNEREQLASFAAALALDVPGITGVIVDNEPNLPFFWEPQFDAAGRDVAAVAYEDLLARTYDAVKQAAPHVLVIGGALSPRGTDDPQRLKTHSPTVFIRDLGSAYRDTGRKRPLMDAFAIHPYNRPEEAPTTEHEKQTQITIADYPKLVTLLDEAFRGTAQRGRTLPIYYTEFGVQTVVPPWKRSLYSAGSSPKAELGVSTSRQAAYYREGLVLAYCQPTVKGLFVFHTFDEPNLDGWQSGLYYVDRTPKPSLRGFRESVAALREGGLTTCR